MFPFRSSRLARRFKINRIFTFTVTLLIFVVSAVTIKFYQPVINSQLPLVSPATDPQLIVNLISFSPAVATSSGETLTEYYSLRQTPFQVMRLEPNGQLVEVSLDASTSAQAQILIFEGLPEVESTKRLFDYWKQLSQLNTPFEGLWLSDSHIGILFSDPLLTFFSVDTSASEGLETLQQIRSRTTMNLTGALIDLRFDKPVVTEGKISIE